MGTGQLNHVDNSDGTSNDFIVAGCKKNAHSKLILLIFFFFIGIIMNLR